MTMSIARNGAKRLIVVELDGDVRRRGGASTAFGCHESASEGGSSESIGGQENRGANAYGEASEGMPAERTNSAAPPPTVFDYLGAYADYYGRANERKPANYTSSTAPPPSPEPPRWRFVSEAKKTSGYSSDSAGSVVEGLSSEELAGTYNSRWRALGGSQGKAAVKTAREIPAEARGPETERRTVGRLRLQENDEPVEDKLVGRFIGFRTTSAREHNEESPGNTAALTASDEDSSTLATAITTFSTSDILEELDRAEQQLKEGRPPSTTLAAPTPPLSSQSSSEESSEGSATPPEDGRGPKVDSRRQTILLNLLLLAIFAIVLGAVTSGRPEGEGGSAGEGVNGHKLLLPWEPDEVVLPWDSDDYQTTNVPTSAPTRNATAYHFAIWVGDEEVSREMSPSETKVSRTFRHKASGHHNGKRRNLHQVQIQV